MKKIKLILSRCLMLFVFIALCQLLSHLAVYLADACYSALHKWFGDTFPLYSPIGEGKEKYELSRVVISLISYTLALFFSVYLSILLSNRQNEHLISRTEGFFTLGEGFGIYARSFLPFDLIASAFTALIFLLPIRFIPDAFFTKDYSFFFTFQKIIYDTFGLISGAIASALVTFGLHIIAVFPAMSRWRAAWLTGFAR